MSGCYQGGGLAQPFKQGALSPNLSQLKSGLISEPQRASPPHFPALTKSRTSASNVTCHALVQKAAAPSLEIPGPFPVHALHPPFAPSGSGPTISATRMVFLILLIRHDLLFVGAPLPCAFLVTSLGAASSLNQ